MPEFVHAGGGSTSSRINRLVDVLLADGEPDEAWSVATSNPQWDPGEQRWQRLAEAREPTDPSATMTIYLRLAGTALIDADRRNYQVAVRHLKAARRAAITAGRSAEFDHHVGELRDRHRRRPTLIAMLDKANLR